MFTVQRLPGYGPLARTPTRHGTTPRRPILIVEILSGSTRRRDQVQKRSLYLDAGVADYWIFDPERRVITVVRPGQDDVVARDEVTWSPPGTSTALTFPVARVFE